MKPVVILSVFAAVALVLDGCRGISAPGEKQARQDLGAVANQYRPHNERPSLPQLTTKSSLSNLVEYALLNSPTVQAAFYDWSASVENVTVTRSLPDPQLTFQAYIQNTLTSLMPGLAWNFPGPGKLKARGRVAVAESQEKYFAFENAVLQTAFKLKRAYYQLGLVNEQLFLKRQTLLLLQNQEHGVQAENMTGSAALADLLSVQSERDRIQTELANLEDSRRALLADFKAALGLTREQADPPEPAHFETDNESIDPDVLLHAAFERNPQLKAMEADVRAAEAGISVAYKERVPNFSASLMAEVYSPPFYWPQASMSLPIWRDKIAAEAAQAKADKMAAQSRWSAAQIDLAVNFAEKLFAYREAGRNLTLIEAQLLPQAHQSLETVQASYRDGTKDFSSLTGAELALVDLKLEAAEAQTDRQIALAELSLIIAGLPPSNAPLLSATH